MNRIATALMLIMTAGCATVTPHYDARFGNALRQAKQDMTLNPGAGKQGDQALGLNGKEARETAVVYTNSFKEPPPAVPVINIGGAISTANGNGR
ncbi:hypothetical protein [Noviherbaspirillum galbum]|uniref:Lipoprotein n=1 Tax=Noviherbaspirillum galbum TaxID=2709383 RepID=A0A6B3SJQ4_9BURK|nr:hypothetical protein [Noviherbaspirillum galbum]NEX61041.1 hypothetical protein [Noviherbaspirillum galbum]